MVPSARVVNHSGCSVDPGVVGGGLQREVERDLEPELAGLGHEGVEVVEVAEVGVDGVVAAVPLPMAHGEPDVVGAGVRVLLGPLRLTSPMGWIRRQVDTSKPMSATAGSRAAAVRKVPLTTLPEASVPRALGAREELVPAGEQRPLPVDAERVGALAVSRSRRGWASSTRGQLGGLGDREARLDRARGVAQRRRTAQDAPRRCPARLVGRLGGTRSSSSAPSVNISSTSTPAADLDAGVVQPGAERVAPRLTSKVQAPSASGVTVGRTPQQPVGDLDHPHGRPA